MATFQREETYIHKITLRENSSLSTPSSIKITITNPCGEIVVDAQDMDLVSEGVYSYGYSLPTLATFGMYTVKVKATDTYVSIFNNEFYVLPWNIVDQTRKLSGITSKKSISDDDIAAIIWEAYLEALRDVYIYHKDENLNCNPNTGAWFDGTNTTFSTKGSKLADSNGDEVVTGYGETSCGTDVDGWWKDTDGNCHQLKITVLDSRCGKLTLTQWDGTPIPSSASLVKINYYTEWRTFSKPIFRSAVAFLAAHKCIDRFTELGRATLADLHSNKTVILHNRNRMEKAYKKAMRKISKPILGAGMPHGE